MSKVEARRNIIIFVGPTLGLAEARALLPADYRPPAAQGDIYRAAREQPWGIGFIDGHFEHVPAVWHKEILWALHQGVRVFGAASMGALRAAELCRYGMVGVGKVFKHFADGTLEDDDEVTVAEAESPAGSLQSSVAMVDIRATLNAAQTAGVVSQAEALKLLTLAKQAFYPERSYRRLFEDAEQSGVSSLTLSRLRDWLPEGQVNQKREDALELLERIRNEHGSEEPFCATFHFERTDMWHQLELSERSHSAGRTNPAASEAGLSDYGWLLDEVRIGHPDQLENLTAGAQVRALASEIARFEGRTETIARVENAAQRFRSKHELFTPEQLRTWLSERSLTPRAFNDLMTEEAKLTRLLELLHVETQEQVLKELHLSPLWPKLYERARRKARLLAQHGLSDPDPKDPRLPLEEAESSLPELASRTALGGSSERVRLLLREAWFQRLNPASDGGSAPESHK